MQPECRPAAATHSRPVPSVAGPTSKVTSVLTLPGRTQGVEQSCILPVGFPFPGIMILKESIFGAVSVQTPGCI